MTVQNSDFYQNLRDRLREWLKTDEGKENKYAEYLMFAPDMFHLMCKLSIDPDVSTKDKAKLAAAIAYFISPIDLISEAIVGPAGYVDDIALSALVLSNIINNTEQKIIQKHWAGDEDVLIVIKNVLNVAEEMVGAGLWKRLQGLA